MFFLTQPYLNITGMSVPTNHAGKSFSFLLSFGFEDPFHIPWIFVAVDLV